MHTIGTSIVTGTPTHPLKRKITGADTIVERIGKSKYKIRILVDTTSTCEVISSIFSDSVGVYGDHIVPCGVTCVKL